MILHDLAANDAFFLSSLSHLNYILEQPVDTYIQRFEKIFQIFTTSISFSVGSLLIASLLIIEIAIDLSSRFQ
jgi:hypothetical protein